jgi:glutaredoxin-like protein
VALISEKDAQFIRDHFAKQLTGDVKITYFTQRESKLLIPSQECMYCQETRELLEEVSDLSTRIRLETHDFVADEALAKQFGIERIPAFVMEGAAKGRVRYFGIPSGYEFSTLIEDIVDVSRGQTDLSAKTKEALAGLPSDVGIQVFVTPT